MGLRITGPEPGRNDLCSCGSKLKFKWCHGDESKRVIANRVANLKMMELVLQEQKKRGIVPFAYQCDNPDCKFEFDKPIQGQTSDLPLCPKCQSPNIIKMEEKNGTD